MSLKILHLSDLHIGEKVADIQGSLKKIQSQPEQVKEILLGELRPRISMALKNAQICVDVIVVTGDLFDQAMFEGNISLAIIFFEELIKEINGRNTNLLPLTKSDVLFVPGNHEIDRCKASIWEGYKEFLTTFYDGVLPDAYDQTYWSCFKIFDQSKVIIAGFNSANYKKESFENKFFSGLFPKRWVEDLTGDISSSQLEAMKSKLEAVPNKDEYRIIVLLHHHFYLYQERNKKYVDDSVLRNSEEFLRELYKYNVSLILHGHKHDSVNRRMLISPKLDQAEKIATILGCGSTDKVDTAKNTFNYIEVFGMDSGKEIVYTEFIHDRSGFVPQPSVSLPLKELHHVKTEIEEALEIHNEIHDAYKTLKNVDTFTRADILLVVLNKTIGTLTGTATRLKEDGHYLALILSAVHFKYHSFENKTDFMEEIDKFLFSCLGDSFNSEEKKEYLLRLLKLKSIFDRDRSNGNNDFYIIYKKLKGICNDREKKYLFFAVIGLFLTEFFLVVHMGCEEFFNARVKRKADIVFESCSINHNIEGGNIEFETDEEHRALKISVVTKDAQAHKVVALIIKEFERALSIFEQDFASVGFRIYYIIPKLTKIIQNNKVALESYNFAAYIPTLVPLLAGKNLYYQPEVFARELIQNSIDAINLRKEKDLSWLIKEGRISFYIGERSGKKYFEIQDDGTGMDQYILERYFTGIGRSFYKSEDFERLNPEYVPISQFGIGFLSCFMVGKQVEVHTRHYEEDEKGNSGYKLEIPNFDGCFFIEHCNKESIGTKITVYEDQKIGEINKPKIEEYIKNNIVNIEYDVYNGDDTRPFIERFHYLNKILEDTRQYQFIFFLPLNSKGEFIDDIDMAKYFAEPQYRSKYLYGIFLYKTDSEINQMQFPFFNAYKHTFLNAGINVRKWPGQESEDSRFKVEHDKNKEEDQSFINFTRCNWCFNVFINFPSAILDLNVSRDSVKKINVPIFDDLDILQNKINTRYSEYVSHNNMYQKIPYNLLSSLDNRYSLHNIKLILQDEKLVLTFRDSEYTSQELANLFNKILGDDVFSDKEMTKYQKIFDIKFYYDYKNKNKDKAKDSLGFISKLYNDPSHSDFTPKIGGVTFLDKAHSKVVTNFFDKIIHNDIVSRSRTFHYLCNMIEILTTLPFLQDRRIDPNFLACSDLLGLGFTDLFNENAVSLLQKYSTLGMSSYERYIRILGKEMEYSGTTLNWSHLDWKDTGKEKWEKRKWASSSFKQSLQVPHVSRIFHSTMNEIKSCDEELDSMNYCDIAMKKVFIFDSSIKYFKLSSIQSCVYLLILRQLSSRIKYSTENGYILEGLISILYISQILTPRILSRFLSLESFSNNIKIDIP